MIERDEAIEEFSLEPMDQDFRGGWYSRKGLWGSDVIFCNRISSPANPSGNGKDHRVSWAFLSLFSWSIWAALVGVVKRRPEPADGFVIGKQSER